MTQPRESDFILGVYTVDLEAHRDRRGRFAEIFRKEWFPQRRWEKLQWSRSESQAGVLRGLHFHREQIDYWHCAAGRLRVGLYDLRRSSPTCGRGQVIDLDQENLKSLFIPAGVAHGFRALADATLMYLVDNYYDGGDEFGVAWNDPQINLPWGTTEPPILSERDAQNPLIKDIALEDLPS